MSLVKKIILTVILVVFLIFIQSYVFSESCSVSTNLSSDRIITLGCSDDDCYFRWYNNSNVSPDFTNCESSCKSIHLNPGDGNYEYTEYRGCIEDCISQYVFNPPGDIVRFGNIIFTKNTNCYNKNINVELGSNLRLEIKNLVQEIKIEGLDSLITNSKNISLYVDNTSKDFNKKFNLKFNLIGLGESELKVTENSSRQVYPHFFHIYKFASNLVEVDLENIVVKENSKLDFEYIGTIDTTDFGNIDLGGNIIIIHSEQFKLNANNILNKGDLFFNIKTGDGKDGLRGLRKYILGVAPPGYYSENDGKKGGDSGNIFFELNDINNFGKINFNLETGKSGKGGDGLDQRTSFPKIGQIGNGGDAGLAGNINLSINNIYNNLSNSELIFEINPGEGGFGGKTGKDRGKASGTANNVDAGHGGKGGSIFLSDIKKIINLGYLKLDLKAGYGGDGGYKHQHSGVGKRGNGGDAGKINNGEINIEFIQNNKTIDFDILDGLMGYKGRSGQAGSNGELNSKLNLKIDYLINSTSNFLVNLNMHKENVINGFNDLTIEKLQTGSYLPKQIDVINKEYDVERNYGELLCLDEFQFCLEECDDCCLDPDWDPDETECPDYNLSSVTYNACLNEKYTCIDSIPQTIDTTNINRTNRNIRINSCYINPPLQNIFYNSGNIILYTANRNDFEDKLISETTVTYGDNLNCSVCDYFDLKDSGDIFPTSADKFIETYTLFSNVSGQIPAGELKIYYARNNPSMSSINNYNPFLKQELPLYTNKETIIPEPDGKLGLFKYKIEPENLEWYYDKDLDLKNRSIYCFYQNYRIKGKINTSEFDFPFTPLFSHR
jgi:hypothetical protein